MKRIKNRRNLSCRHLVGICLALFAAAIADVAQGQSAHQYTHQDTLRGSITTERAWWDLLHYTLEVEVFPETKSITGKNTIQFRSKAPGRIMQIDLQEPMQIDKVTEGDTELDFRRDGNAYFITCQDEPKPGTWREIEVSFSGTPQEAIHPPWDGGFTWQKDENGVDFIATSCQGIGASLWWPCKDHMYDEPDEGLTLKITVPKHLVAVGNGRLDSDVKKGKKRTFTWKVINPINNYGVNVNVGDYVHFGSEYEGEKGKLDTDYWVLSYNLEKAKEQFKDGHKTLEALEHWFGPYPFYEDSYKLVEVPYLGMEHQSSVTYGNQFMQGYLGRDLSGTGWGLKFDFIIVHESGHEWFANSITHRDAADMWIHESFTSYSESLFLEYFFGKEAGQTYVRGTRLAIENKEPMIADYDVNAHTTSDVYYKGSNMLNTLRTWVNDDEKWRSMLRGMNSRFFHQTVSSADIETYMADFLDMDLKPFFDQYLRDSRVPALVLNQVEGGISYKWTNCREDFNMPITLVDENGNRLDIAPTTSPNGGALPAGVAGRLTPDPNYYIFLSTEN